MTDKKPAKFLRPRVCAFRLGHDEYATLEHLCKVTGLSKSGLVRGLLREAASGVPKPTDTGTQQAKE